MSDAIYCQIPGCGARASTTYADKAICAKCAEEMAATGYPSYNFREKGVGLYADKSGRIVSAGATDVEIRSGGVAKLDCVERLRDALQQLLEIARRSRIEDN